MSKTEMAEEVAKGGFVHHALKDFIYHILVGFSVNLPGILVTSFLIALLKLLLASLIAGALMNLFGLSADRLLAAIGLTPAALWEHAMLFVAWAVPNIILGAVIILPLWFFAYLFIPPRGGGAD